MRFLLLAALLAGCAAHPSLAPTLPGELAPPAAPPHDLPADGPVALAAPDSLDELLAAARAAHGLPALAALVRSSEGVLAEGAAGVRCDEGGPAVTLDDPWHLGSCTKSMTATLAALFVARGELAWSTTVGEAFSGVPLDPAWAPATLEHLLTNSSGAPAGLDQDGLWGRLWTQVGTPSEQRMTLVEGVLAHPPVSPPGTAYLYSNAGFSIAGAMLERAAGAPYEELMQRELFAPLGLASAGFGAPGSPGAGDAPCGHVLRGDALASVPVGPGDDNPPAIAPAGRAHMSLRDWGRYAALHLAAARGAPLPAPFDEVPLAELHRPRLDGYAMGWLASSPDWCQGPLLWHNGSNTMWYCEVALFPAEDLAVLVATNTAHGTAREAVSGVLRDLHGRFARPAPAK